LVAGGAAAAVRSVIELVQLGFAVATGVMMKLDAAALWFHVPGVGAGVRPLLIAGPVLSMLIPETVALALLPALSVAVPVTLWLAPSPSVVGPERFASPESASLPVKLTVTSSLYQPAP